MSRGGKGWGAGLLAALFGLGLASAQTSMQTLLTNGPAAKRVNVVFLSEGYTTNELGKFLTDAQAVLNNLLVTPPFRAYSNHFNAFAISVPSVESGSDHPATGIARNTYFNSTYDTSGIARLLTINSTGRSRVNALLATYLPLYDIVAVIVNDPEYGGSGGFPLVTSVNIASPEIAIHELGHSFSGLGDEYSDAYPGYPDVEEPNTTTQTSRAAIKWTSWIEPTTPVPTPATGGYSTVVGLFEGAHYHPTGWYRPKLNCKMRALSVPFCEVCAETLVKSVYGQIRPIESIAPATNNVISLTNSGAITLGITNLSPVAHALQTQWFVNNTPVIGATSTLFSVTGFGLPAGTNLVRVEVADPTTYVRNDSAQVLKDRRTWRVAAVIIPPRLAVTRAGGQVLISWPTGYNGFRLETSPSLNPPTWSPMFTIANETNIIWPSTADTAFFRMRWP